MAGEPTSSIFIGSAAGGANPQQLELKRANRHGLIAGATGTGKTVTLQGIVEGLSAAGVPCFVADVKGDLSGLAMAGSPTSKVHPIFAQRATDIGMTDWTYHDTPVQFWDLFGEQGHPIRTTVSEMGPLLLSRLMNLNDVQEGVLNIAFNVADKEGLLLLDLDDLQSMMVHCGEKADELTLEYGNVSKQSVGSIQRSLLQLRSQGGDHFFGEPALDLHDFIGLDDQSRGVVNILAADRLMASPRLYATFLLWLLSELFEELPEIGDPDKPILCFFFDEAHLLFDDAPSGLLEKVEQVVRLIRSKGVGVYFITQNPIDIPDKVAAQLNNRIQHKLNAFTPRDQQAVKAAADTFRVNPDIDVATAITELKIGEALVSLLQPDGSPEPVQRTLIKPPSTRVGPLTPEERSVIITTDAIGAKYDTLLDPESAEEILKAKADEAAAAAAAAAAENLAEKAAAEKARQDAVAAKEAARAQAAQARLETQQQRELERQQREQEREDARRAREAARRLHHLVGHGRPGRSIASSVGRQIGNQLLRGIFGGLLRGR
jgi:uncharacterized protein